MTRRGRVYTYREIADAECIYCGEPITLQVVAGACSRAPMRDGHPGQCVYLVTTTELGEVL